MTRRLHALTIIIRIEMKKLNKHFTSATATRLKTIDLECNISKDKLPKIIQPTFKQRLLCHLMLTSSNSNKNSERME